MLDNAEITHWRRILSRGCAASAFQPLATPDYLSLMTTWVRRLLVANVVVFALQYLWPWLTVLLAFTPRFALLEPWTVLTHMFVHGSFTHILFNMIGLFFFGSRVEERLGSRRFVILYFTAGATGAALSAIMAFNASIIGASGGVFGVMLAFARYWPRERIYIWGVLPIEAWLLVVITTALSLYSGFGGSRGGVADFAHLGGYLGAAVYLWALERFSSARRFKDRVTAVPKAAQRSIKQNLSSLNLDGVHELSREEVNRILDKISAEGLGSLTAAEKLFLSNFVPPDDRKSWTQ